MILRAVTLSVTALMTAAPGAAQERASGYAGLLLGTQGVGLEAAMPVTQRWWLGARAQRGFDARSAYVVLPFEVSWTSEIRVTVTPGVGMRDCAAIQLGGEGRTGCESQGGWDLSGLALVIGEIFPHGRTSWSLGGELGTIVEPNPGTWLVASGFIRIWFQ